MRVINLDTNKLVIETKTVSENYINNPGLQLGEVISELGEIRQIQQADGSFVTTTPTPITPQPNEPTNAEIAQMISDLQADLTIAGVI